MEPAVVQEGTRDAARTAGDALAAAFADLDDVDADADVGQGDELVWPGSASKAATAPGAGRARTARRSSAVAGGCGPPDRARRCAREPCSCRRLRRFGCLDLVGAVGGGKGGNVSAGPAGPHPGRGRPAAVAGGRDPPRRPSQSSTGPLQRLGVLCHGRSQAIRLRDLIRSGWPRPAAVLPVTVEGPPVAVRARAEAALPRHVLTLSARSAFWAVHTPHAHPTSSVPWSLRAAARPGLRSRQASSSGAALPLRRRPAQRILAACP